MVYLCEEYTYEEYTAEMEMNLYKIIWVGEFYEEYSGRGYRFY